MDLEARLDALFAVWNRGDAPGVAVGVVWRGAVAYRKAFGMASLESGVALSPRTRMRIGSTSKHMTALLALLLADEGRLDLDAPVRNYLPELTGPGGEPTLRMLLQHRGGSRCYIDLGFIANGMATLPIGEALASQARQTGRNFAPGAAMIYNNGGYHLVSLAIEHVGGAPFEQQLKTRLFDPLGLADTASIPSDLMITPGMATLHLAGLDGGWRRGLFPTEELRGEGAVVSTVDDMIRWMGHLRTRDRFGSKETWKAQIERPRLTDGSSGAYGLGLIFGEYRGAATHHHAGGVVGGSCQMIQFPDHDLDIVILSNGAPEASPVALAHGVADIVLGNQLGSRSPLVKASTHGDVLGHWWSPTTGMLYGLVDDAGELKLSICGASIALPLSPRGDGVLVCSSSSLGDIVVDLGAKKVGGALPIYFGGETHDHVRLKPLLDAPVMSAAIVGTYVCADADCSAKIDDSAGFLQISFRGRNGGWTAELTPLSTQVAIAVGDQAGDPFPIALSFDVNSGDFNLNSARTRALRFKKFNNER